MKLALLILTCVVTQLCFNQLHAKAINGQVQLGTQFESNVFLDDKKDLSDGALLVRPQLSAQSSEQNTVRIKADGKLNYKKYLTYSTADQTDYYSKLEMPINERGTFSTTFGGDFAKLSDPPLNEFRVRVDRNDMSGFIKNSYQSSENSKWLLNGSYAAQTFVRTDYEYLNHVIFSGDLIYDYKFLPETSVYFNGQIGMIQYPSGKKNASTDIYRVKYDSTNFAVGTGVRGRLTQTTRVDASFAYLVAAYDKEQSFAEPVFKIGFEEQLTPKDLMVAGFDYTVADSLFTNWVLTQNMYIGYGRVFGDQLVVLTRMNYEYKSFSKPNRREDQRVYGLLRGEFSTSPKIKILGDISVDVLNSDAVIKSEASTNNLAAVNDPTTSYKLITASISLVYVF